MLFQNRQRLQRDFFYTPKFLENLLWSKNPVRGAATRTKTVWAILRFWFLYFLVFPFKAFEIDFPCKLKSDIPLKFVHCLQSPFLNIGIIIPVCQSLGVLSYLLATWNTLISQRIFSSFSIFNISGLISSYLVDFLDFIPLTLLLPLLLQWTLPLLLNLLRLVCHGSKSLLV